MTTIIDGTSGITTPMYNGSITANPVTPSVNMKNRIINGAMVIDQRNAGASSTASAFTVDRWSYYGSQTNKGTWQQNAGSVTPPSGFSNYLGFTSSSAYSVISTDFFEFYQGIEGFNIADLGWGTANAKTVTLSFWVRSSLTGTFGGFLGNNGASRVYPYTYTISSANTWEQKSITIVGDTSGTWLTNNGMGIQLAFTLGAGSAYQGTGNAWNSGTAFAATGQTQVVGTNGATFYITGVQLEVGSTASSFDYRQYGAELALCQRYYEVITCTSDPYLLQGAYTNGTNYRSHWYPKVTKRATPTFALINSSSWTNTPSIYTSVDDVSFYNGSSFYYLNGTSGVSAASLSAEL